MSPRNVINNIFIAITSVLVYRQFFGYQLSIDNVSSNYKLPVTEDEEDAQFTPTGSSVWCRGEDPTHRLCRFKNLCYHPENGEFIFFHGKDTIISGLKLTSHKEFAVELSSVEKHNGMQLAFIDVPVENIQEMKRIFHVIPGMSFLMMRFKPNNVMHVFHDDLLPLHSTLLEISSHDHKVDQRFDIKLIFADQFSHGPFWDLYQLFSSHSTILLSDLNQDDVYCFQDVYAGLNRNTVWYQYGFFAPQGPWTNRTVTAMEINRFSSYLINSLKEKIIPYECPSTNLSVLLSRKGTRLILNEDEVAEAIASETKTEVAILSLDDTSLVDIISHVRCSKFLVGVHGSLLVLGLFLSPGSTIIELFPYAVPPEDYTPYKTLANIPGMGITYKSWSNIFQKNSVPHPDWPEQLGGIQHLSKEEQEAIQSEKTVKPHPCCHDPRWLFRIYQDTLVEITSLRRIIQEAIKDILLRQTERQDELQSLRKSKIFPGNIEGLSCENIDRGNDMQVMWHPPWNVLFSSPDKSLFYEIWTQYTDHAHYTIVSTSQTTFVIKNVTAVLNVWVRCRLDKLHGILQWIKCVPPA